MAPTVRVNLFSALAYLLYDWTIGVSVGDRYTYDADIGLFGWILLRVRRSRGGVKQILTNKRWKVAWPYDSFCRYTRMRGGLVDPATPEDVHARIHQELASSMAEFPATLRMFARTEFQTMYDAMLKDWCLYSCAYPYVRAVWFKTVFGPGCDLVQLERIHDKIGAVMARFYKAWYWRVPLIGPWLAEWFSPREDIYDYMSELSKVLLTSRDGFDNHTWILKFDSSTREEVAFLSFLVLDLVFQDFMIKIFYKLRDEHEGDVDEYMAYTAAPHEGIFFPWRLRKGRGLRYAAVNIVTSDFRHSLGYRACVGASAVSALWAETEALLNACPYVPLYIAQRQRLRNDSERPLWIPNSTVSSDRRNQMSKDTLQEDIIGYEANLKGQKRFYKVQRAYEHTQLINYAVSAFAQHLLCSLEHPSDLARMVVVSPEARGWPLAARLSGALGVPLCLVRKSARLPFRDAVHQKYETSYDSEQMGMLTTPPPVHGVPLVVIVDDGVSKSRTVQAVYDLVRKAWGEVQLLNVLALFRHFEAEWDDHLYECEIDDIPVRDLFCLYQSY